MADDMEVEQSGSLRKKGEDLSPLVDAKLPPLLELAKQPGKLSEAVEQILLIEKQTRQGGDAASTSRLATAIVDICFAARDLKALKDNLVLVSKRRGQLKQAVQAMVKQAMTLLDQLGEQSQKLELIETLRTITEGKIYVENERAHLTRILARIKEDEGALAEAAELLQEIQIETYGAMEQKDKVDYILEQMRLCLDSKSFIKAQILSKKISPRVLNDAGMEVLKQRFYRQMIRFWMHENNYIEIYKAYHAIYETAGVKQDDAKRAEVLRAMVVFLLLAPHDNERSDFLARLALDTHLPELPQYKALVTLFLTMELMQWPTIERDYAPALQQLDFFAGATTTTAAATATAAPATDGAKRLADFRRRVIEHDIRVLATYYQRISLARFSQLLHLPREDAEQFLADLVVAKSVYAKIDRPKGVVSFVRRQDANEMLNAWSHNISELLDLVEKTCHLIHRETMVHKAAVDDMQVS